MKRGASLTGLHCTGRLYSRLPERDKPSDAEIFFSNSNACFIIVFEKKTPFQRLLPIEVRIFNIMGNPTTPLRIYYVYFMINRSDTPTYL